jgi:hypothetical protein
MRRMCTSIIISTSGARLLRKQVHYCGFDRRCVGITCRVRHITLGGGIRFIQHLPRKQQAMEIVWSAARLQAESLSWVVWSAQMYPACLWRQAPGHNGVRASLVYKDSRTQEVRISRQT